MWVLMSVKVLMSLKDDEMIFECVFCRMWIKVDKYYMYVVLGMLYIVLGVGMMG